MTHLFYFLSISHLLICLNWIIAPKERNAFLMKIKGNEELERVHKAIGFFSFLWLFIGFFSSQWLLFLLLFISSMIPKTVVIVKWVSSIVSALLILFILINKYHLHIDILSLIR